MALKLGEGTELSDLSPDLRAQVQAALAAENQAEGQAREADREVSRAATPADEESAERDAQRARERHAHALEELDRRLEFARHTEEERRKTLEHRDLLALTAEARRERSQATREEEAARRASGARRSKAGAARRQAASRALAATSVLPRSAEVRTMDALVLVAVSALTVVWTATRTATSALGWGVFWVLLGGLMFVEGRGALLKYGGAATSAANASYLALRVMQLVKTTPQAGYIAAREVRAAYLRGDYATMQRVSANFLQIA